MLPYLKAKYPRYWKAPKSNDTIISWGLVAIGSVKQKQMHRALSTTYIQLKPFVDVHVAPPVPKAQLFKAPVFDPVKNSASNPLPFAVGDFFDVLEQPSTWASPGQCPLNRKFDVYPFRNRRVEKIEQKSTHIYIFDGVYGWCYHPNTFVKPDSTVEQIEFGRSPFDISVAPVPPVRMSLLLEDDDEDLPMVSAIRHSSVKVM